MNTTPYNRPPIAPPDWLPPSSSASTLAGSVTRATHEGWAAKDAVRNPLRR
jgi:hypothetical protein